MPHKIIIDAIKIDFSISIHIDQPAHKLNKNHFLAKIVQSHLKFAFLPISIVLSFQSQNNSTIINNANPNDSNNNPINSLSIIQSATS